MEFPQVVDLNVGGRHLTTSLAILTKYPDSMLAAMFSGRHHVTQDKDGRFFIDVNGDVFEYVLDFLRLKTLPPEEKTTDVLKYAEYFDVEELKLCLTERRHITLNYLHANWASAIPKYSEYLEFVKEQLKRIEIREGLISLQISSKTCVPSPNRRHTKSSYKQTNHKPDIYYPLNFEYSVINVEADVTQNSTLVSVMAEDLKKMGIYPFNDITSQKSCCKYARMFKVGFQS